MCSNTTLYPETFEGINFESLVDFTANEFDGGSFQTCLTDEELEDGAHYRDARLFLEAGPIKSVRQIIRDYGG